MLVQSSLAQKVWNFEVRKHKVSNASLLKPKVNKRWLAQIDSPCHKVVLPFIPLCIVWFLWRNRNPGKYEGRNSSSEILIKKVLENIKVAFYDSSIVKKKVGTINSC